MTIAVREASEADWPSIWPVIREVAADGETFAMSPDPPEADARASWMTPAPGRVVVATEDDGAVVGTANMYANRPHQGAHVASGSFMVPAAAQGRGVGRALVRDMIAWATDEGFRGIQFNAVVASNERALRLYSSEGFRVVGAAPGGFRHPTLGPVDLLVLWRDLPARTAATSLEDDVAAAWQAADRDDADATVARFERLHAAGPHAPVLRFELASAYDWVGREADAVPHYEAALAAGLDGDRDRRARIQLGSSLRNVGRADDAVAVLDEVVRDHPERSAAACFLALALAEAGRPRDGVAVLVDVLSRTAADDDMTAYREALRRYAGDL